MFTVAIIYYNKWLLEYADMLIECGSGALNCWRKSLCIVLHNRCRNIALFCRWFCQVYIIQWSLVIAPLHLFRGRWWRHWSWSLPAWRLQFRSNVQPQTKLIWLYPFNKKQCETRGYLCYWSSTTVVLDSQCVSTSKVTYCVGWRITLYSLSH